MSGLTAVKKIALNTTRGKKGLYTVHPLTDAPKRQEQQQPADHSATLAELETAANDGTEALQAKWQAIGAEARKALAAELDRLKSLAAPPSDDVPFDRQPATQPYDGA